MIYLVSAALLAWAFFGCTAAAAYDAKPKGYAYDTPGECAPGFLAMDPDGPMAVMSVIVRRGKATWAREYVFPIGARCREARELVVEVLSRAGITTVVIGTCH